MIKKDRRIYHEEQLRAELVSSLRLVDLAILGQEGTLYETVEHIKPDVIALGYDQLIVKRISQKIVRKET